MGLTGWISVTLLLLACLLCGVVVLLHLDFQRARVRSGLSALGIRDMARVLLAETVAYAWLGWWHLRALGPPRRHTLVTTRGRPVLCVHGYTQNSSNFWGLRAALQDAGRPSHTVFLGLAWPWRRLEGYAVALERALDRHREEPDGIDVVAHSMGGLVLRIVLAKRPDLRSILHRVVTLGTPHGGTALARLGAVRPLDQLTHGAPFLADLPSLQELCQGLVTTIGSEADMVVYPIETAFQPGSERIRFRLVGHTGLLVHRQCIEATVQALTRG